MPVARSKRSHRKESRNIKLPEGAHQALKKGERVVPQHGKGPQLTEVGEVVADQLMMTSPWQSYSTRPTSDLTGYYVIAKWFPKLKQWAILYVGHGRVQQCLDLHFSGRRASPLDHYLASFSKAARTNLWLKWFADPLPGKDLPLDEVITAVQQLYNKGERPAFNFTGTEVSSPKRSSHVPDNFSILDYA